MMYDHIIERFPYTHDAYLQYFHHDIVGILLELLVVCCNMCFKDI